MLKFLLAFGLLFAVTKAEKLPIRKVTFENGLVVLTKPSEANDIVAVEVLLRMGPLYERDEEAGLSDITQRLLLKGTESRTAEELAEEIESLGAKLSSGAFREYGYISLLATKDRWKEALELLFDVVLHPKFPEDEVEQEKQMALKRIKARRDRLLTRAVDLMREAFYGQHPHHKPVLGYPETVSKFSREEVVGWYRKFYVPNNMVLAAVGNFPEGEFLKEVEENLADLPEGPLPEPAPGQVPGREESSETFEQRESRAVWAAFGYPAPSVSDRDFAALEVLDAILGGAMDSRLFVSVRDERGLAYQIGSSYIAMEGPSLFLIYLGTRPERFEEAKEVVLGEVERMVEEQVPEEELEAAKTYIKGTFLMSQERNMDQASLLARYELTGLGYRFVEVYPELIDAVTAEDVLRAARRYLSGPYVLGAVVPE